ncbi:MAG: hypothetical protein K9N46_04490 [Candidatus Marinimicrobia bacterium]|nr:hypothetical protein [Candidatus Neomarinimicrobiota bacterium]MCF7829354.1 hypothetical protein [Candidatus Neomarinimicrobiota bacterium]MCF7879983.1 hypothetical protein [Candidatus Neomarinimicrobiota bacterium]
MNKKDLIEKKNELMNPYWTENLHHALKELQLEDAKKIVESMTDDEIYSKVNNRRFQEDYIADYIEFLWDISESSFWKHVKTTLDVDQHLLWSDNMFHFKMLCSERIPNDVLIAVIKYAVECPGNQKQNLETIGCVIKAQAKDFGRLDEIKKNILLLEKDKQVLAETRIKEMIECECNYKFD